MVVGTLIILAVIVAIGGEALESPYIAAHRRASTATTMAAIISFGGVVAVRAVGVRAVGVRIPPDGGIDGPLIVKAKHICRLVVRLKVCKHSSH